LMTGINIPDMSYVIRQNGLVPVPVDIDAVTLQPNIAHCESTLRALHKQGKSVSAFLVAHLWGKRIALDTALKFARHHNLSFIEDCAEAYSGPDYRGDDRSDIALFSFGSIKVGTAFGGALVRVPNDRIVLDRMRQLHRSFPVQPRSMYLKKIMKNIAIMTLLNLNSVNKWGTLLLRRGLGIDSKPYVVAMLRGFPGDDLIKQLRQQPATPLLTVFLDRLTHFDRNAFAKGKHNGDHMLEIVNRIERGAPPSVVPAAADAAPTTRGGSFARVMHPGTGAAQCNYWLFPLLVPDAEWMVEELNRNGVDAYRGATQLAAVSTPVDLGNLPRSVQSEDIMQHCIYLPVHRGMGPRRIAAIGAALSRCIDRYEGTGEPAGAAAAAVRSRL